MNTVRDVLALLSRLRCLCSRTQLVVVCLGAWLAVGVVWGGADFDRMLSALTQRWGSGVSSRFVAWQGLLNGLRNAGDAERLKKVNEFFNRHIAFGDDQVIWAQPDYWATPLETLGRGAGDCEDYVIAKYFSLKEVGVASEKLRLIYVRAKIGSGDNAVSQAHMVLAYYTQPESEPLVLDNLVNDIRPASRRPDLVPVFSFNSEGVYTGVSAKEVTPNAGVGRLSRWEDLLKRAKAEGFD